MTAGLYAARARLNVVLLEKLAPGGQILNTHWVDNYPGFPDGISGFELVDRMRKHAERFGLEFQTNEVTGIERDGDSILINLYEGSLTAKALIVATGSQPTKLGVPGEIDLVGKGVSYCATCDGPFYRDLEVGVVGGGDTAVEEALFLTKFASKIHLFHRRDQLRATGILREKITADPKVEIHWSSTVQEIVPDDKGLVGGVIVKNLKTGETGNILLNGIFMFVGQVPITQFLGGFLELDPKGFVITDSEMATSQPGVFAAGDIRSKRFRQISTAVGDGATAVYNAEKYLEDITLRDG